MSEVEKMCDYSDEIPESYRGEWCDKKAAEWSGNTSAGQAEIENDCAHLRAGWAETLLKGDLKAAHRLWGKWQGYAGRDPWEDEGWRNFWEAQQLGQRLWEDFDASRPDERLVLRTFISYWPGP